MCIRDSLSTSAWLEFDGFDAAFHVNTRADRTESLIVYGTHGRIEIPRAYNPPVTGKHQIFLFKNNDIQEIATFEDVNQFALQIAHLSDIFAQSGTPRVDLANSQANQLVLDAIKTSAITGHWTDV
jgi:predicted dehydrogenase